MLCFAAPMSAFLFRTALIAASWLPVMKVSLKKP
jgi:hypothetical protein